MNKIQNVVKGGIVYTLGALTNAELTSISGNIATISGQVDTNVTDIATISGNVSTLSGNVNTISGKVDTNTSNISTISGNVNTISGQVDTNTTDIGDLKTNKQDKLTQGVGIEITSDNTINVTLDTTLFEVVTELPTEGIKTNRIYLVPNSSGETGNIYIEYIYVNGAWEKVGEFKAETDLSDYYKKGEVNALLDGKVDNDTYNTFTGNTNTALDNRYTKTETDGLLDGKVDNDTYNTFTGATNTALDNRYTKDETYSQDEIDTKIEEKSSNWFGTLAEYQALEKIDENTAYFIVG